MIISPLQKIKAFIEDHSPHTYSLILAVPVTLLVIGYMIWNVYLFTLGLTEEEIIRGKFILAGGLFVVISIISLGIIKIFLFFVRVCHVYIKVLMRSICNIISRYVKVGKPDKDLVSSVKEDKLPNRITFNRITLTFVWFFAYTLFLFPILPEVIGGGHPSALALIASKEDMLVLNSLGIPLGPGATYQTQLVCIFNQDSKNVYIFVVDRVIIIDRSLVQGFVSLPGQNAVNEQTCIQYAKAWAYQGFQSELILLETTLANMVLVPLGLQSIIFNVVQAPSK